MTLKGRLKKLKGQTVRLLTQGLMPGEAWFSEVIMEVGQDFVETRSSYAKPEDGNYLYPLSSVLAISLPSKKPGKGSEI